MFYSITDLLCFEFTERLSQSQMRNLNELKVILYSFFILFNQLYLFSIVSNLVRNFDSEKSHISIMLR